MGLNRSNQPNLTGFNLNGIIHNAQKTVENAIKCCRKLAKSANLGSYDHACTFYKRLPTNRKDPLTSVNQIAPKLIHSFFLKMGQPRPLFHLFSVFSNKHQFLQQIYVKNVHPVYGAGI